MDWDSVCHNESYETPRFHFPFVCTQSLLREKNAARLPSYKQSATVTHHYVCFLEQYFLMLQNCFKLILDQMEIQTLILVFEPIVIFLHFGIAASETLCSEIPILSFNEENCLDKDAIQNVKLLNDGKNPGKALNGLAKFYLQELGSLKEKRCLLISNLQVNHRNQKEQPKIILIMANFKNNVLSGIIVFEHEDGQKTFFDLNEKGQFCKTQTILIPRKDEIGPPYYTIIKHTNNEKYYSRNLKTVMHCKHFGKIYGISCMHGNLRLVNGFPTLDESLMDKDVIFDIYLPKDEKRFHETKNNSSRNICHSSQHLSAWLRVIEIDHWISLGKSNIESKIGLDGVEITIDLHEARIPRRLQPTFVEIFHNGILIHEGRIDFDRRTGLATINVKSSKSSFKKLFDDSFAMMIPFEFVFSHHMNSKGKVRFKLSDFFIKVYLNFLFSDISIGSKITNMFVSGFICKTGFICGFVKKYGVRARDESVYPCKEIDLNKLTYFGFHDGLSGKKDS